MRTIEVIMQDNTVEKFYPEGKDGRVDYCAYGNGLLGISKNKSRADFCTYAPGTWKKVQVVETK